MSDYTLSDIAAVANGDGMGMGGNWIAWIVLFALFGGGFGGWGGARGQAATTEDLASGFNFSALQSKTNDILAAVNNVNQNIGNAVCTSTYELASKIDGCLKKFYIAIKNFCTFKKYAVGSCAE